MLKRNEGIRTTVSNFGSSGEGVCLIDGFPVFVQGALPGEEISATVTEARSNFAVARLGQIHRPSPQRTSPLCPYYGRCGGCSMMHMEYGLSLSAKEEMVSSALWHVGRVPRGSYIMEDIIPSPQIYGYRNKAVYRVNPETKKLCYHEARSRRVADIGGCMLQSNLSNAAKAAVESWLASSNNISASSISSVMIRTTRSGDLMVAIITAEKVIHHADKLISAIINEVSGLGNLASLVHCLPQNQDYPGALINVLYGNATVLDRLCGLDFTLSPQAFFQVNPLQTENLYAKAIEYLEPKGKNIIDAYCGAGTISLAAAKAGALHISGIETVAPAVENARYNAAINGISNCAFICETVESALPKLLSRRAYDALIIDPPRKGCSPSALDAIAASNIPTVVYVSCNPATLARDIRRLASAGYRPISLAPADMFPHTPHVETVVLMSRNI
ncbi:MAG: 23S rRNA (uracil(1939)-C(5))-methyltransferase RlmD [Christensenellales bacterium]|jgi:23S rRNA (uracil1939-C5)-methyltransferase